MEKNGRMQLILSACAQKTLLQDVQERSKIEACGLLTGRVDGQGNWLVEQAHPLHNISQSPVSFEFAPEELLNFELEHPGETIGVYHSHPTGYPEASSTDRQNMRRVNVEQQIPWAWLIICGPFSGRYLSQHNQLASYSLVAYHHYTSVGLRQLHVLLRESDGVLPAQDSTPDSR